MRLTLCEWNTWAAYLGHTSNQLDHKFRCLLFPVNCIISDLAVSACHLVQECWICLYLFSPCHGQYRLVMDRGCDDGDYIVYQMLLPMLEWLKMLFITPGLCFRHGFGHGLRQVCVG